MFSTVLWAAPPAASAPILFKLTIPQDHPVLSLDLSSRPSFRLSWNLGKLYTLKNDRRKIEVSRRQIDVQRETFLFNTRLQLLRQNTEIKKMTDLMRADDDIIRLRTSIKQAAEVKLENGVISVTDLIREINAEDMARQTAAAHRVQRLMTIYNYMYTTN